MRNLAVIDIGSNSVRLLLRADGAEKQMLETTRLGQGVAERMLQPEPVRRTVEAIGMFCRLARETGAEQVFAFATSAVRDARNPEALLDPVFGHRRHGHDAGGDGAAHGGLRPAAHQRV